MINHLFVGGLALLLSLLYGWAFRALPGEGWQVMAVVPLNKRGDEWDGLNLTYYGFFMASATVLATALFCLMLAALGIPLTAQLAMIVPVLGLCFPAAKLVAILVEGKRNTLTVGGAAFVGCIVGPAAIWTVARLWGPLAATGRPIALVPVLAALAVAYCFGEGLGRLACISFGCCYGKPLSACGPLVRRLCAPFCFRFFGKTKKVAYAGNLEGQPVLPVQALTAGVLSVAGLIGLSLFLARHFVAALLVSLVVSQLWRFLSEFLRADYRGGGRLSAYQLMSLATAVLVLAAAPFLPADADQAVQLQRGAAALWRPWPVLSLQMLGVLVFIYSGRSQVTAARLSLIVLNDKI